jgi:hypothetical protein
MGYGQNANCFWLAGLIMKHTYLDKSGAASFPNHSSALPAVLQTSMTVPSPSTTSLPSAA